MSEEHISRPEFNLYVQMNAESGDRMSRALDKMATDNKTMHDKLLAYFNKHDRIEEKVNANAAKILELSEAVIANSKLTSIANKLFWGGGIVIAGALGTFGKDLVGMIFK